ncbi:MAG: helix-turn-helix transcriptional regulator [Chloroflexota bacterium]
MAINQLELERHHELAEFLRSRRARLSPEEAGLPRGTRRRTPGLRREEVAMLAGVSPEWYTWLEQGRDINVSMQLLESLARVLQLDANEREHLFLLVLRQPPPVEMYSPPTVSPSVQIFLDSLGTSPACVVDSRTNVIGWNAAYCAVFVGDFTTGTERERNLIWRIFTNPAARVVNEQWKEIARVYVAQFRAGYGRFINDPWWAEQIAELSRISPEFRELWARHDVHSLSHGRKLFHHPIVGELDFDILWLQTVDSGELRMLTHTPRNADTIAKIQRLLNHEPEKMLVST